MNSPVESRYSTIYLLEGCRNALHEVRGGQSRGRKVLQRVCDTLRGEVPTLRCGQ
jgi:hypothetical protein